jgi:hypothetical protein
LNDINASSVSVEDDECSGQPSTSKTAENVELIHEDHRQTIHQLADTAGISYGVHQDILMKNLNVHHIAMKFGPPTLDKRSKTATRKRVLSYKRRLMRTQLLSLGP